MKVYIPNRSSHDYSNAERFGELISLTTGNLNLLDASNIFRQIAPEMNSSESSDKILLSGPTLANIIACSLFVAKHSKLNLLLFRRNGTYVERNIVFNSTDCASDKNYSKNKCSKRKFND